MYDVPEFIGIYLIVVVNKDVTKSDYSFPRGFGVTILEGRCKHIGSLSDYFEILDDGIKQH